MVAQSADSTSLYCCIAATIASTIFYIDIFCRVLVSISVEWSAHWHHTTMLQLLWFVYFPAKSVYQWNFAGQFTEPSTQHLWHCIPSANIETRWWAWDCCIIWFKFLRKVECHYSTLWVTEIVTGEVITASQNVGSTIPHPYCDIGSLKQAGLA